MCQMKELLESVYLCVCERVGKEDLTQLFLYTKTLVKAPQTQTPTQSLLGSGGEETQRILGRR